MRTDIWHITIDGTPWCQFNTGANREYGDHRTFFDAVLDRPRNLPALTCDYGVKEYAETNAQWLRDQGLTNVEVHNGACQALWGGEDDE